MEFMFLDIINSNSKWYEIHRNFSDALKVRGWLEWFLKQWGFSAGIINEKLEFEKLSDLRSVLANAADTLISGEKLGDEKLRRINDYLALSAYRYDLKNIGGRGELTLKPLSDDWNLVMSEIAASFIKTVNEKDAGRFRRCENPDCKCVFYDFSKNRSKRWCCNSCSSLIKVRRFREKRQKELT